MKVTVADTGIGNLHSLRKGLERAGASAETTSDPVRWLEARVLVLPGVGAFDAAMRTLGPVRAALRAKLEAGTPALAICLGLHVLGESSEEGQAPGIGFLPGRARRFPPSVGKVPHMGWSRLQTRSDPLFGGLGTEPYAYFVHSYYVEPDPVRTRASTTYGISIASVVRRRNVYATQFHPEKSGADGQRLLRNFLAFAEAEA